jgi:16S rRNA (cytidine1402-2'-O)-methyltransferase
MSGLAILRTVGTLLLVATPIGNLGDITLRALEALKGADAIACEDTRHTLKLLSHFEIRKPMLSCHANDEERGAARVLALLAEGKTVAYCSDAGTPGLSDPGAILARRAREAGHGVSPLPGPSAFASLISASGFGGRSFLFDGFPSPKAGRRASRVRALMDREESFVLYESPYRVARLLADIAAVDPLRRVCIGREMTKIHEEFLVGSAAELAARYGRETDGERVARGEFSVLVAGRATSPDAE